MVKFQAARGESEVGGLVLLILVLALAYWYWGGGPGLGENEGTVTISDCREIIELKPETLHRFFKPFTCESQTTGAGWRIRAMCVNVEYDSSGKSCKTAYTYRKEQDPRACKDPRYPSLNADDTCSNANGERVPAADRKAPADTTTGAPK